MITLKQKIISSLENIGPMTAAELRQHLDRGRTTIRDAMEKLRRNQVVHVANYVPQEGHGGRRAPLYALGNEPDAVEPPGETIAERNAKYNRRHSAIIAARRAVKAGKTGNPWRGLR